MTDQDVAESEVLGCRAATVRRSVWGARMMTDASASERAYQHLRRAILGGKLRPEILDIRLVSDQLRMSATPVREALARLSAERLVRFVPHHGYTVVRLNAQKLEELYDLSGLLIAACLRSVMLNNPRAGEHALSPLASAYADKIAALLQTIAGAQPNRELAVQIEGASSRLFMARQAEPRFFPDADSEAAGLAALWASQAFVELGHRLEAHHRDRAALADSLARVLDTAPDAS